MRMTSLKHKILLVIFGLFIAILLGEAFFKIWGSVVYEVKNKANAANSNVYRILCIGDSNTYGLGSSDINKFSYPAQLQRILNEKIHDKKFEVLNLGVPGINSSQVLNRFRKNIKQYKPNMVIVMVGINDPWNLEESNILKFYSTKNVNIFNNLRMRLGLILNKSQLYQFFKLVFLSGEFNELNIPEYDEKTRNNGFIYSSQQSGKSIALVNAIISNITEIAQIAEDNHVNIMFMKYHNIGWGRPELVIHHTYTRLGIPIVDNAIVFRKARAFELNVLGKDKWHPNDLGYKLIAKNIYNQMILSGFIDGNQLK